MDINTETVLSSIAIILFITLNIYFAIIVMNMDEDYMFAQYSESECYGAVYEKFTKRYNLNKQIKNYKNIYSIKLIKQLQISILVFFLFYIIYKVRKNKSLFIYYIFIAIIGIYWIVYGLISWCNDILNNKLYHTNYDDTLSSIQIYINAVIKEWAGSNPITLTRISNNTDTSPVRLLLQTILYRIIRVKNLINDDEGIVYINNYNGDDTIITTIDYKNDHPILNNIIKYSSNITILNDTQNAINGLSDYTNFIDNSYTNKMLNYKIRAAVSNGIILFIGMHILISRFGVSLSHMSMIILMLIVILIGIIYVL